MGLCYPTNQYLAYLAAPYRWVKGDDVDKDGVTCSEFVTAAAAKCGLWDRLPIPALTAPLEFSNSDLWSQPRQEIVWDGMAK